MGNDQILVFKHIKLKLKITRTPIGVLNCFNVPQLKHLESDNRFASLDDRDEEIYTEEGNNIQVEQNWKDVVHIPTHILVMQY